MRTRVTLALALLGLANGCATTPKPTPAEPRSESSEVGVLVMAHGGSATWNRAVTEVVAGLALDLPTAVAFGMADPGTLATGLEELSQRGVTRIALVRLFLSGESFRHQTEYLLGIRPDRPRWFASHGDGSDSHPAPIQHTLEIATHADGLSDAPDIGRILVDRAGAVSRDPANESVLLLAHGMGGDTENDRLLTRMREAAASLTNYHNVRVATLREDWPAKRALAETQIRALVVAETEADRRVIVVPFRLFGAGPYEQVLQGLDYLESPGLVPHAVVTDWVRQTVVRIACTEGWAGAGFTCP